MVTRPTVRPVVVGWNIACPKCSALVPAPNSLIGLCIWSAEELRDYPRAWCERCQLSFLVGQPDRAEVGE